jgi:hypothetical protein
MGGAWGALLGAEGGVRGGAAYGTVAGTWYEYLLENARRQQDLAGQDAAKVDLHIRQDAVIQAMMLGQGLSAGQLVARHPELREHLYEVWADGETIAGRTLACFRQLAAKDQAEAWGRFDGHALAIRGEADYVTSPTDHELIARLVNRSHPGRGRSLRLAGSDHGFARAGSEAESFARGGQGGREFNPAIVDDLLGWANEVTGRTRGLC